jgi:O-antigen biosynthesis protein WbqV
MGTPVNIYELARALTLFAGFVPGEGLPIHFTGLREGEKVSEELWEEWEVPQATDCSQVFKITGSNPLSIDILPAVQRLQDYLSIHDQISMLEYLNEIVPSFASQRATESKQVVSYAEEKLARIAG